MVDHSKEAQKRFASRSAAKVRSSTDQLKAELKTRIRDYAKECAHEVNKFESKLSGIQWEDALVVSQAALVIQERIKENGDDLVTALAMFGMNTIVTEIIIELEEAQS